MQKQHKQWFLGQSMDTFCPMGPFIMPADEVDLNALQLTSQVNGTLRKSARASDVIFSIAQVIAPVSRSMTLLPGNIIATGTPAGVGFGMTPPEYLRNGDFVTVMSDQIEKLLNPVVVSGQARNDV